ncbi:MAG: type I methionyl aminopeptidase [Candidatus Omnitrophica bacterium]|nr:type I methionyl aminopeptidase [Candidatus Omnitrophota bacterium]
MISLKSKREIQIMADAGAILKEVFREVGPAVKPGITTDDIDRIAERVIRKLGGEPAFKGYRGFPKTACISVNEEVVHGIPGSRRLHEGDLISFDIGVKLKGYFADSARSWAVGKVSQTVERLIATAKESLFEGLKGYQPGSRIGDLSERIQRSIESQGFGIVREYVGHGIGRAIHEDPQVPNFGKAGHGAKIQPGLVIAIEPMVTEGHHAVETLADGWTVVTRDRKWASHYEDTIAFTEEGFMNLTGGENA